MDNPLQEGIAALKAGDKVTARRLLGRAIQQAPKNVEAWLWLSGAVDTDEQRLTCLNKVLAIDPGNELALKGLASLQQRKNVSPPAPPPPSPSEEKEWEGPGALTSTPDWSAALVPAPQVTEMLDHSKSIDQLSPEKRRALEHFVPLIAQDVGTGRVPLQEVIDRLVSRGFPRKAADQLVKEIALQPIRAPIRYQKGLSKQDLEGLPSPWFSIFADPRETMRRILYYEPKRHVILLAMLDGIVGFLSGMLNSFVTLVTGANEIAQQAYEASQFNVGAFSVVLIVYLAFGSVLSLTVGPLAGLLSLYIYSALLRITGRWLRGKGYPAEIRAAIAWSRVPRIWGAILLIVQLLVFGYVAYINAYIGAVNSSSLLTLGAVFTLLESAVAIWSFVILLQCLGEAHHFSAWRALGAVLLAYALIAGVFIVLGCLFNVVAMMMAAPFSTTNY
jgi:hypothetical protein